MANTTDFAIEKPTVGGYRNTWGGTINSGLDKLTELLALALPIGSIQMYPKVTAPTATGNGGTWLVCQGQSILNTLAGGYKPLYDIIGNTYGSADSTHFNLPDLRARIPVGYNATTIGSGTVAQRSGRGIATTTDGTEKHVLTTAQLSAHSHPIPATTHVHTITDASHAHVGVRSDTGAGTEDASLSITDNGHFHDFTMIDVWGGAATEDNFTYGPQLSVSKRTSSPSTSTKTTGISIADHNHTFNTNTVATGITGANANVIGITSTAPDTGSNQSHNNMQPYQVVNYIILAKHPTFS